MILADENIYLSIITALRQAGIDTFSVYENHRGMSDQEIVLLSLKPPRIILTEDKDFGELAFAHYQKPTGVILLRYAFSDTDRITRLLIRFLQQRMTGLEGTFVTITVDKIRIRNLM